LQSFPHHVCQVRAINPPVAMLWHVQDPCSEPVPRDETSDLWFFLLS